MAVGEVAGARTVVVSGNRDWTRRAIFGVCDVPPQRMTYTM